MSGWVRSSLVAAFGVLPPHGGVASATGRRFGGSDRGAGIWPGLATTSGSLLLVFVPLYWVSYKGKVPLHWACSPLGTMSATALERGEDEGEGLLPAAASGCITCLIKITLPPLSTGLPRHFLWTPGFPGALKWEEESEPEVVAKPGQIPAPRSGPPNRRPVADATPPWGGSTPNAATSDGRTHPLIGCCSEESYYI
ncbi:hypothetical protein FB451DRAFT_1195155 [Mycena latifolia]|nr:hypothetical protein FB451DRAFT_1195155 [Mycena latifolia]